MIDLGAEIIDVNVHDVGEPFKAQVPYVLDDHRASHSAAGIAHQVFQHGVFTLGEIDGLAATSDHVAHAVQLEVLDTELIQQFLGTAEKSVDPGQQLFERKRLHQVVVSARL